MAEKETAGGAEIFFGVQKIVAVVTEIFLVVTEFFLVKAEEKFSLY